MLCILFQALKQLGYVNTIILPMVNSQYYHYIRARLGGFYSSDVDFNSKVLHIAIAPHEEQFLFQRYVVIQMEQTWSPYFTTIYPRFKHILSKAKSIWTFSNKMKLDMIKLGHRNVYEIPVYTDSERSIKVFKYYDTKYKLAKAETLATHKTDDPLYISDIFMFGSYSKRRGDFFYSLRDIVENVTASRIRENIHTYLPDFNANHTCMGYKGNKQHFANGAAC